MEDIFRDIDEHFQETVGDLERLLHQPSISAQGVGLTEMAELLAEMLRGCGASVQLLPVPGGGPLLVYAEIRGQSDATLLFYNHYDVQPPDPLEEWESPPFEPKIAEGQVFARGASDNKGNIVARLAAIKAIQRVRGQLPVSVKFCIEGEEEVGSPHLRGFIQGHRDLLRADACIWEGSGVNWLGQPTIVLGAKGLLYVELEVRGPVRDVHSSWATVVPNPAWRLVHALSTLKDQNERVLIPGFYDDVRSSTQAELEAIDAAPRDDEETLQSFGLTAFVPPVSKEQGYLRRHLLEPTCNIAGIVSGYIGPGAKTVLPAVARAKLDLRLVPDQRPEDILRKLRRHLDEHGFSDIAIIGPLGAEGPARTPMDAPFVKLVAETAEQVYGSTAVVQPTMAGTGPMDCFIELLDMPVADSGVGYPDSRIHAPNENIRLEDLRNGIKHLAAIMEQMGERPMP